MLGGEIAAWVDCGDAFDPISAAKAGADLGKMLWVQCGHRLELALKAADMILHSGGFGLVILDICDASDAALQRIPLSYWYRIRRAMEGTPAVLLVLSRHSVARACATRQFVLNQATLEWRGLAPFQTIARRKSQAISRKPMSAGAVALTALGDTEGA
jgi:recA bacterial DNA recombination protein